MMRDRPGTFGDLLRERRVNVGISQEQLAEMTGVSAAAIGALERGTRRSPHQYTLSRLVEALRLSEDERSAFETLAQAGRVRSRAHAPAERHRHIPIASTPLLGREGDIASTLAALANDRVVTVTGPGGIGKTRLALEIARRAPVRQWEHICFADLTPLTDGRFIAGEIASAMPPPLSGNVESVSDLVARIGDRRLLLILDNCESLIADAAETAHAIVSGCPHVTILATSRERLQISGERVHRLPALRVPVSAPHTLEDAATYSALDLFLQRSRQRDPSIVFTNDSIGYVYDICRRLDGIPLAIELVVARLPFLGIKMLDALLDEYFSLPGAPRNLPPRQRTMEATIAWSFELLEAPERELLLQLAIFHGGFTLDAAQAVCAIDSGERTSVLRLLAALAEKSLINTVQKNDGVRYVLLDSTRTFAAQQLDRSGLRSATARRHAEWLAGIGDRLPLRSMSHVAFAELAPELDNVRAALAWTLASPVQDDHAIGGRIITGLRDLWALSGRRSELRNASVASLEVIDETMSPEITAQMLQNYIVSTFNEPDVRRAIERAIPLFDRIGNARATAKLHSSLTFIFASRGEIADAQQSSERVEALFLTDESRRSQEYVEFMYHRAMLREAEERFDEARADIELGEAIATSIGYAIFVIRKLKKRRIFIESAVGNLRQAVIIANDMLASEFGTNPEIAFDANQILAVLHLLLGEADAAARAAGVVLDLTRCDESLVIQCVAGIAGLRGDPHTTARLMGFTDALLERVPSQRDSLQQRVWDLVCSSVAKQLMPEHIALLRAEGRTLTVKAAANLARAVLNRT